MYFLVFTYFKRLNTLLICSKKFRLIGTNILKFMNYSIRILTEMEERLTIRRRVRNNDYKLKELNIAINFKDGRIRYC